MQVYNLGVDEKTHKPSATFEYNITNLATNKQVIQKTETTDTMGNIGDQVTLLPDEDPREDLLARARES